MSTRITLAVVAILVGALAVAGVISLSLERNAATRHAETTVLAQTRSLASALSSTPDLARLFADASHPYAKDILDLIDKIAGTRGAVLVVASDGTLRADLLRDVPASAIDARRLAKGEAVHGVVGGIAYAAVPILSTTTSEVAGAPSQIVAYALESSVNLSADSALYYLLAGVIALVVAALVASAIARRISRRVVDASQTATRIAGGDLDARVELPPNDYPELASLGVSLNTMAAALARARRLEREFLLSISHDLRTPLTSIRGYAEAIADDAAPDPARAAQIVVSEARRLERLIGDLLDLARLNAHQFSLHRVVLDAGAAAADAAEALRYEFEASAVDLTVVRSAAELPVEADPDRLAQVVANLVENALKFATTTVRVAIADEAPGSVAVTVEDDGPGIAPEDLPHVFERLFTSSRRPARTAGTGLGLAIVSELAAAMDGTVAATSPISAEGGTRISVRLPKHRAPAPSASR
ncbi:MAG TPA: HAMP domain-containing sensor histidine kinase [Acidimicrobiales bacterium]|nr:HAMP domain-containing sensor histidine kinase [Acidimicrobiales bacterium]